MAKRKTSSSSKKTSRSKSGGDASLSKLKEQIDLLDREILEKINQRAEAAQSAARLLQEEGESPWSAMAEFRLIDDLVEQNGGPLSPHAVRSVFRELLSGTRQLAAPLKVAYLGPLYSYSHIAAVERFGQSVELLPVATIAAVFDEVHREQVDYGLVPIENTTDGRIADTLDMFSRVSVRICGEVQMRIHHNLLAKCSRDEIREVYSKPQALSQCRDWLALHLPEARMIETASTTAAAREAAERPGAAAVASLQAATNYGLDVVAADIEDNRQNVTRFAVLGHHAGTRTGKDKTSLMFQIRHQPGALAEAMNVLKRKQLNMTWIESFPLAGKQSEYLFFVEVEGHEDDELVKSALAALKPKTLELTVLGSYGVTATIE